MDFGSLKEFLEYLNKYMFLEKKKIQEQCWAIIWPGPVA
jgi:hypothetical protein